MPDTEDPRPPPRCPFCGSEETQVISLFGTQAMVLQYRCQTCRTVFEANKYPTPTSRD